MLQSLNLYYNCISSLAEVFRLRSLTELTDVDLRLNPVVKTESGYLLFVVHMLPKLRQLGRCLAALTLTWQGLYGCLALRRLCC